MACPDPETVELRWTRPDGEEAVAVVMRYATADEATVAVDACLMALEERRHAGTGSHVALGNPALESNDRHEDRP